MTDSSIEMLAPWTYIECKKVIPGYFSAFFSTSQGNYCVFIYIYMCIKEYSKTNAVWWACAWSTDLSSVCKEGIFLQDNLHVVVSLEMLNCKAVSVYLQVLKKAVIGWKQEFSNLPFSRWLIFWVTQRILNSEKLLTQFI